MVRFPKKKVAELKETIEDGLHLFGKAMNIAQQMCEGEDYGERYGERFGEDDGAYYGERAEYGGEVPRYNAHGESVGYRRSSRTGRFM